MKRRVLAGHGQIIGFPHADDLIGLGGRGQIGHLSDAFGRILTGVDRAERHITEQRVVAHGE
jgi:hypothetical protein